MMQKDIKGKPPETDYEEAEEAKASQPCYRPSLPLLTSFKKQDGKRISKPLQTRTQRTTTPGKTRRR